MSFPADASEGLTEFRLGIDVGGTFTDLVLMDDAGRMIVTKTPSTPRIPAQAVEQGLSLLAEGVGVSVAKLMDTCVSVAHGTTVATNTLLERRGARTALLTTAGFRDLLEMREGSKTTGRYDLLSPPPVPLVPRYLRLPVQERVRHSGEVETPLDPASLTPCLEQLDSEDIEALAVCLLHSTVNPLHEQLAGRALTERFPGLYVCLSHQVLPQVGEYDRLSTTVVNAYVGPILSDYLHGLGRSLRGLGYRREMLVMQSHGGVLPVPPAADLAAGAVLSGPAAGVYGAVFYGDLLGMEDLISLDIGGTSTDIALVEGGRPAVVSRREVGGTRIALPSLAVHTLGAGGGSVAAVGPDGLLGVGPKSAGAEPGPACYGQGGASPTVTDANLLLGYLNPDRFLGGSMVLYRDPAEVALNQHVARPMHEDTVRAAFGVHRLVNVQMAEGIRVVTVREGHDPRRFTLLAGGGAAGMHAVALARELGIPRVVVPRLAPVISALGLLATDVRHELVGACLGELGTMSLAEARYVVEGLVAEGQRRLAAGGIPEQDRVLDLGVDLLYANQVHALRVPMEDADLSPGNWPGRLRSRFEALYCARYGYHQPEQPVQARAIRLTAIGRLHQPQLASPVPGPARSPEPIGERRVYLGEWVPASVYVFEELVSGERLSGPAVVDGDYTTVLLPSACYAEVDAWGGLIVHVS